MSVMGEALAGLGRFREAEPLLLRAWDHLAERRDCAQRLVSLYEAWHTAEPGGGFDAKAAQWKGRLEELPLPELHLPPAPSTADKK
jgi:hypothetical protein